MVSMDNLSSKSGEILKTFHTSGSMPNEVHLTGLHVSKEYSQFLRIHSSTTKEKKRKKLDFYIKKTIVTNNSSYSWKIRRADETVDGFYMSSGFKTRGLGESNSFTFLIYTCLHGFSFFNYEQVALRILNFHLK